jgi:large repetitive protein
MDVDRPQSRNNPSRWYRLNLHNNIVVDNMAGLAGGGISLQDSARVSIVHNTVANNDSTATAGAAFAPGSPNQSTPQPAGIVARAHSDGAERRPSAPMLDRWQPYREFANPTLDNNIVWHNRSFYWAIDTACDPTTSATPCFGLQPVIAGRRQRRGVRRPGGDGARRAA